VLDVSPVGLARLRNGLEAMFIADAPILGGQVLPPSSAVALEQLILGAVMDALRDGRGHRDRNRGMTAHALVNACHRLTLDNLDAPPSIAELCTRLGTSRRTIQDSFQKIAQTTSLSYLRALRLNLVRQALHRTLHAQAGVGELAAHRGFSQLSHFAQQYKRLFGELPSQTLRADALAARP
jgi:AraC family ethanolamine operon transcriptional activator